MDLVLYPLLSWRSRLGMASGMGNGVQNLKTCILRLSDGDNHIMKASTNNNRPDKFSLLIIKEGLRTMSINHQRSHRIQDLLIVQFLTPQNHARLRKTKPAWVSRFQTTTCFKHPRTHAEIDQIRSIQPTHSIQRKCQSNHTITILLFPISRIQCPQPILLS